jgi:hypothetical protein
MTECDEVALTIWGAGPWAVRTGDEARLVVRRFIPDETPQIIDNIAEALLFLAGGQDHVRS